MLESLQREPPQVSLGMSGPSNWLLCVLNFIFLSCVVHFLCNLVFISTSWYSLHLFIVLWGSLLMINSWTNNCTLTETAKRGAAGCSVFSVASFVWCSRMCHSAQSEATQLLRRGDAVSALAACLTSLCCGKKALRRPADCAHRLPLCDFSLSWEVYTSTLTARWSSLFSFMMRDDITHAAEVENRSQHCCQLWLQPL